MTKEPKLYRVSINSDYIPSSFCLNFGFDTFIGSENKDNFSRYCGPCNTYILRF